MPRSYLWAVAVAAVETLAAVMPVRRSPLLGRLGFMLGYLVNELPFVAFSWLVGWTAVTWVRGELASPGGLAVLGLAVLTTAGLVVVGWRGRRAGPIMEEALRRDLGRDRRSRRTTPSGDRRRVSLVRILLAPLPLWRRDVERIADVPYGPAGRRHRLDLYRGRAAPPEGPVLIHFHGGHFRMGGKSREARPLLHRLASQGWLCVSANYRLGRAGRFPNSLVDAKRVVAWVREHAEEYGAVPSMIVVAGSSAGAHLASMVALTPGEAAFQPDVTHADTSVDAAVCLYGYLGDRGRTSSQPSSPLAYVHADAPPFLVVQAGNDTVVPSAPTASLVDALRATSTRPVVDVELPGAQHAFDLFHSLRFERVVDGIEDFLSMLQPARERDHRQAASLGPPTPTTHVDTE